MTLDEAARAVGKKVSYSPRPGVTEHGTITRVGQDYVFVLYEDHLNTGPMATRAADLERVYGPRTVTV